MGAPVFLYDRVQVTVSGTPGTGAFTLSTAVSLFQSAAAASVANNAVIGYAATDGASNWEYGRGTYNLSAGTLTRTTILGSSNSGSAVNFSSNTIVTLTVLAEDLSTAVRTAVADTNYTALVSDRLIAYTSLTAARVVSLPAASSFQTGAPLVIVDESGACSATNMISLSPNGSDTINGLAGARIQSPNGYLTLESNGSNAWTIIDQAIDPSMWRGYLAGLTLANDVSTPNTVIDIGAGVACSDDQAALMKLAAGITKSIASNWTVGSGNGGLDTGSVQASGWYHLYLIQRLDTGVVDVLLSQAPSLSASVVVSNGSPAAVFTWNGGTPLPFQNGTPVALSGTTAPGNFTFGTIYNVVNFNQAAGTFQLAASQGGAAISFSTAGTAVVANANPVMPANYTKKRRIGSIKVDASSHILAFSQNGDEFLWLAPVADLTSLGLTTSAVLEALTVPIGVKVNAMIQGFIQGATVGSSALINSPDVTSIAGGSIGNNATVTEPASNAFVSWGILSIRTNQSQQLRFVSGSPMSIWVATIGWLDPLGH